MSENSPSVTMTPSCDDITSHQQIQHHLCSCHHHDECCSHHHPDSTSSRVYTQYIYKQSLPSHQHHSCASLYRGTCPYFHHQHGLLPQHHTDDQSVDLHLPNQLSHHRPLLLTTLLVTLFFNQLTLCWPLAEGSPVEDVYQHWLKKGDKSLRAVSSDLILRQQEIASSTISVEVMVDTLTIQVIINGKQVLRQHNKTTRTSPTRYATAHRGVHVIAVHPHRGTPTLTTYYRTWQPRATKGLVQTLTSLQPGTLLVLAAPGDWRYFFDNETNDFLEEFLGGWWVGNMCHGEMWVGVATVSGPLWGEAATTHRNYTSGPSTPLWLEVEVPRTPPVRACAWYGQPELQERAAFCEKYEGYGDWCSCHHPTTISPAHASPAPLVMKETIPIVIVTSRHQFKVLRQLQQLWNQAGGGSTPILLAVDGYQQEAQDFAKIVGLPALYHLNPATPGEKVRINEHIKFAIFQTFSYYPSVDKIIILED
ncbi:O-linked-mannose beta-1-2-N-acetylglucosaminyltransferase 1-like 24, partial [Homarus americanus]